MQTTKAVILSITKRENDNYSVAVGQHVVFADSKINALAALNKGDERFDKSAPKMRIAYLNKATAAGIKDCFGIDVATLTFTKTEGKLIAVINKPAPQYLGREWNLEIKETTTPRSEYDKANYDKVAKKVTRKIDGVETPIYFVKDGGLVYSYVGLVGGTPNHSRITDAVETPCDQYEEMLVIASMANDNVA